MKTTKVAPGYYEMAGNTTLDGAPAYLIVTVFRIARGGWASDKRLDGRLISRSLEDHPSLAAAKAAGLAAAKAGFTTYPSLGICVNP